MSMASPNNSTFDYVHSTLKSLMTLGPPHSAVPAVAPQSISTRCAPPLPRKCSGKYFLGLLFLNVKLSRFACSRFASCEIRVAGGIQLYSVTIALAAFCYTATIKNYIKLSWTQHSNTNVP